MAFAKGEKATASALCDDVDDASVARGAARRADLRRSFTWTECLEPCSIAGLASLVS